MHHVFGTDYIKLVHYPTWESPHLLPNLLGVLVISCSWNKRSAHFGHTTQKQQTEFSGSITPQDPRRPPSKDWTLPHIFYSSSSLKYPDNSQGKWKSLSHIQLFATPWTNTVHEILQAKILEWVAFPFSRGSSQCRDRIQVSCIAGRFFPSWATSEAQIIVSHVYFLSFSDANNHHQIK